MKSARLTIILLSFICGLAWAQSQTGLTILGVAVKGNRSLSESSIKIQSGLIEGKRVTFEDISGAIQKLWKLKIFSDVQIYADRVTDAGIFLIIEVDEYPRLAKYALKGNKKIREDKIKEEINLLPGKVLSPHVISETVRKIRALYEKDGFFLVEIEPETTPGEKENTLNLTIRIKENKHVRVGDIHFTGNQNFTTNRLRRVLKETHRRNLLLLRIGDYDAEKYREDKEKLITFYKKHGYRDIEIVADSITYSDNKKRMFITIEVHEGVRYKYRNISFSGNRLFSDAQLYRLLDIQPGDWYDHEKFQKAVYDRINGLYMDQGYLFFQIVPREIPVSDNEIDVTLMINENHQVAVNQIHIIGNERTNENVIRRELKLFPGDIFSREALMRSQREIFILNYFSNVIPDVVPVNDKEVDIEIKVEEKSAGRANFSMSISQMHGLIGGGGVELENFMGRGQRVSFSYQQGAQYSVLSSGSTPYKSFSIGFTDPWLLDSPNLVGFALSYSERGGRGYYYYPFDLTMISGSLQWGRRFKWPDNYFRGTWAFNAAKKQYLNVTSDYLQSVLMGRNRTTGISLTQSISRDSRNRPEFPTIGSVFRLSSTLSGGLLGGTEHFHKHNLSLEFYMPAFWKLVLFNSMQFGAIKKLNKSSIIPPDERFIMGGAGMIYGVALRGYDDNQVGPNQSYSTTYLPWGGETLFKYSVELRFPISENPTIYALTFMEAGNVWANIATTDPFDLKRSVGLGVRFFMPSLGMIGVDLGYGFDDIDPVGYSGHGKPQGWKTHLIFGMPF